VGVAFFSIHDLLVFTFCSIKAEARTFGSIALSWSHFRRWEYPNRSLHGWLIEIVLEGNIVDLSVAECMAGLGLPCW
jgi:hypothetical protein